ncbi:VWFA and cache domain-containing protein 1-like isoform X1 [Mizuhopecten yessoensis]|uniref:VWFA and cache domain-containing protein 1-like isoform X1 n=1 Tax=Mizuhopecten yessoensis TaxID=6573 RepID=UPI000B45DB9B|nr:VWFA and cache domain-containing protein 1-like isoform X1 [Mizuhopecten yessoensis]
MGRGQRPISGGLVIILLITSSSPITHSALINGNIFSSTVKTFTDKVGFPDIQTLYNDAQSTSFEVEGVSLVAEISNSLGVKFNGPVSAAKKIKEVVEAEEGNFSPTLLSSQCCQSVGVSYSSKFKTDVALDRSCTQISKDASPNRNYPTKAVEDAMRENARLNPNLKWQYFASEEGYYLSWPSVRQSDCDNYDPRFRPFYVATATPVHKDVVVILDQSGSMAGLYNGVTLMKIAQDAANTVLETLNPNDRVSVVAFESNAAIVGVSERSCLNLELALATPLNQKYLKRKINSLTTGFATNYEAALTKAFDVFESSSNILNGTHREQVILFLTDGKKTAGGDPLTTIAQRNQKLGNRVMIFTYALGNSFDATDKTLLENMAAQTQTNPSYGVIKGGEYKQIIDPSLLRSSMASYYNRFSSNEYRTEPVFSVPYIDLFGLGLITSVCLPVYRGSGDLMGVSCSDVTMADLLSDITYFHEGDLSYAFIIDQYGRTLMHPQLPQLSSVKDDPIFVHIENLERSSGAATVIQEMLKGTTNKTKFNSQRTIPRGSVLYEGIETRSVISTYAWGSVPNSNLSMAIVVGEGDTLARLQHMTPNGDVFNYHRLDWDNSPGTSFCKHFNRYSTKDYSITMLTPGAFKDPINYLNTEETKAIVTVYENFLRGTTTTNPGLKDSVTNSVTLTYQAEQMWKANQEQEQLVLWRYIGTTDGIMRLYPGAQLPKNYDHTRRPWFIRSVALKGKIVFSSPYLDQWSLGYVITVSTTIQEKSTGSSTPVVAVAGTDFRVPYMYQLLLSSYSKCSETTYNCLVVDSSGLVVVHKDFVEFTGEPMIENMHITQKEPTIAEDLLNNQLMIKTSCLDFENIKEQFSYRISLSSSSDRMSSSAGYEIHPVADTNIFVIIKRIPSLSQSSCCTSYGVSPDKRLCGTISCDCLCYKQTFFNYCLDTYPLLSDTAPTCSPQPPDLSTEGLADTDRVKHLGICFDAQCSGRSTKGGCHNVSGCSWCYLDNVNDALSKPFCGTVYTCQHGALATSDPNCSGNSCGDEDGGGSGGIIAGVIIAILIVLAIVIGIVLWRRKQAGASSSSPSQINGVANPAMSTSPAPSNNAQPMSTFASWEPGLSAPPMYPPTYEESTSHQHRGAAPAFQSYPTKQ